MCMCVKPWSYLNVEMNSYLFTWKTEWKQRPQGWSSKTAPRKDRRGRARNIDGGKRAKQRLDNEGGRKTRRDRWGGKGKERGRNCTQITYGEQVRGTPKSHFTILRGETHTSRHIFPLPPTSVCVCVSSCNIKKAVCVGIKSGGTGMQWIIYHYWFAHTHSYTNTSTQTHTHY